MSKILNRYIAREITIPFLLGLSIFTFIMLMDRLLKLTELVINKGVKLVEIVKLIIYILPSFFTVTIPMAFLLAVLLAFGRLSSDEEITAAKSSGISLIQMMPPVFMLSLIAFAATLFLSVYALPWGNHSFKTGIYDIVKRKADTGLIPGRIIDSFTGMVLYITEEDKSLGRYKGIVISEKGKGAEENTIVAKEGKVISTPDDLSVTLRLYDGTIHREGGKDPLQYKVINFAVYDITLLMDFGRTQRGDIPKSDRELSITELLARIKEMKQKGRDYNYLLVEFHKKFSIPFACIVFALIGAPLGIQGKRSGKSHGFVISLFLITVYWMFLLVGETLGDRGKIPPFLSMWAPNIVYLIIGIYLLRKVNHESKIKFLAIFEDAYGYASASIRGLLRRKPGKD